MSFDEDAYLHGFSETERARLTQQAEVLGQTVFQHIDFGNCRHVYEPGCGVGAQTRQLLRKFPHLRLTSLEKSPSQFAAARSVLQDYVSTGQVELVQGDAFASGLAAGTMDGAFICWVLEHVPRPVDLLRETRRVLKPGAVLYATEVFNPSLFFSPACPTVSRFWQIYSDYQQRLHGDPCAGIHLGNFLTDAGFRNVELWPLTFMLDKRTTDPETRRSILDYWWSLFMSAEPGLRAAALIDDALLQVMQAEYGRFRENPELVFYAAAMQARAVV